MSLCHNRNPDLEETIKNPNIIPDNEIINIKQDSQGDLSYGSLRRTKKNKTRMPKEIVFNDDEILSSQYKRGDSSLEFEHAEKNNIKEKNIINFDDNEEIKENHNEKEEENNLVENGQEEDVEMKVEIKDGEDIVIPDSEKSEEEMNLTENKDVLLRNRNNENGEKKEEPKESNNNEVDIKEEEEKKEESNEGNNNNEVDIKENEEKKDEEKEKKEEKRKKEEENDQEKEEKREEKNEEEEKEENEEEKEVNHENSGKKEEPKEEDIIKESEIKDLTKYDQLIKIINKNLESKGFSELDIKNKIDEIYKNLSDSTSTDILITKLSDLLIELMDVSLDSDKNDIQNVIKDVSTLFNGDIIKIHEQLMSFIKGINEQSKLQNRASNRVIRGYIKKCANQLKERLKQEDIPSDKIVSFQKFKEIMNETEVELKEEHLDILLYQMKMKVPKGRSIDTLNMIVVVDFLK